MQSVVIFYLLHEALKIMRERTGTAWDVSASFDCSVFALLLVWLLCNCFYVIIAEVGLICAI